MTQPHLFTDPRASTPVRRVRRGVDATVTALRATGRLEAVDSALVALARTLADALDDEHVADDPSRYTVATIAGRLHPVLTDLRGGESLTTDVLDDALAAMSTAVHDTPTS